MGIDYKKLIEVWNRSNSAMEVGKELKMDPKYAILLACRVRKQGIEMKKMKAGRPRIDWSKLGGKEKV